MKRKKNENKILLDDLDIWYKTHNFIFEKNELYYDFVSSLFDLIEQTYLGLDVLNNKEDILNHFKWCFKKTIENFETENIKFKSNGSLFDYLYLFFSGSFYKEPTEKNIIYLYEFFNNIFDFTRVKPQKDMETYKFIYKLFDINLKV
jgi:hypothetical protein